MRSILSSRRIWGTGDLSPNKVLWRGIVVFGKAGSISLISICKGDIFVGSFEYCRINVGYDFCLGVWSLPSCDT